MCEQDGKYDDDWYDDEDDSDEDEDDPCDTCPHCYSRSTCTDEDCEFY